MKTLLTSGRFGDGPPEAAQHPTFREALLFWLKLGFISFGGPAGQIAIMHAAGPRLRLAFYGYSWAVLTSNGCEVPKV